MTQSTPSRKKRRGIQLTAAKRRIQALENARRDLLQLVSGVSLRRLLLDMKFSQPQKKNLSPGVIEMLSQLIEELRSAGASSEEIARGVANHLQLGPLKLTVREPTPSMVNEANHNWAWEQSKWSALNNGSKGDMYRHVWAVMHDEA